MAYPENADPLDLPWMSGTLWFDAILDAADVASILNLSEGSIRQYAAKPEVAPGFPQPAVRASGRPSFWTPDQIFRYIFAARAAKANRVPRLYCPAATGPAQFLYAERCTVRRHVPTRMGQPVAEFAVHYWRPADSRGPIAIAYPGPNDLAASTWAYAAALLKVHTHVDAVIVITDEIAQARGRDGWQAAVGVAERGQPPLAELGIKHQVRAQDGQTTVVEWGWDDVANLLRVDIPWWSPLLRDINQITAWRPGAPRQQIRPHTDQIGPTNLDQLVAAVPAADVEAVRNLTQRMHRLLEGEDLRVLPIGDRERPGLVQAAEPLHVLPHIPPHITDDEFRWLLHRQVTNHAIADRACEALRAVPGMNDVIVDIASVDGDHHGQLAAEWIADLEPVSDKVATELGFGFLRHSTIYTTPATVTCYRHRHDHDMWVIKTSDSARGHRYRFPLGSKVAAQGVLTEFELFGTTAFFRDSAGRVWPMPALSVGTGYNSGYSGTGPGDLFRAVRALRADAGADLRHCPFAEKNGDPLWRYIVRNDPPLVVSDGSLTELSPPQQAD